MRYGPKQQLELIRRCHQLKAEGVPRRVAQVQLGVSRDTLYRFLLLPCPSQEEIDAAPEEWPTRETTGGLKTLRAYLDPTDFERFMATAEGTGQSISALAREALLFWCETVEQINGQRVEPSALRGHQVQFRWANPPQPPANA